MTKARAKSTRVKRGELPLPDKWDGTLESKARLHKDAQVVLRALAVELGLKKGEFEVHSNAMGPAIGGTIYLSAPTLRMWIEGGYGFERWGKTLWRDATDAAMKKHVRESNDDDSYETARIDSYVTARRCKDGKDDDDYEHDLEVEWELLWDVKKLAEVLRLEGFAE